MIRLELQDPLQKPAAKHDNATHGVRRDTVLHRLSKLGLPVT
jgi:hypothetical protein